MSLLGILNFVVLQWFGIRLQVSFDHVCVAGEPGRWWDREIPVYDKVRFSLLRWVWPLTGWFGREYRFITRVWLRAWFSPFAWFNVFVAQWFFVRLATDRCELPNGKSYSRLCLVRWVWPLTGLWIGSCLRFTDGFHIGQRDRHPAKECP